MNALRLVLGAMLLLWSSPRRCPEQAEHRRHHGRRHGPTHAQSHAVDQERARQCRHHLQPGDRRVRVVLPEPGDLPARRSTRTTTALRLTADLGAAGPGSGRRRDRTIAVKLQDAGYRTAMIGKYVNRYPDRCAPVHVPPGWDTLGGSPGRTPRDASELADQSGTECARTSPGIRPMLWPVEARNFITLASRRERALLRMAVVLGAAHAVDPGRPARQSVPWAEGAAHAGVQRAGRLGQARLPAAPKLDQRPRSPRPMTSTGARSSSLQAVDEAVRSVVNHLQSDGRARTAPTCSS